MKQVVVIVLLIFPAIINAQFYDSILNKSALTIGVYGRTQCGIVTDKTRDLSDDNELVEAVMDKTGISEIGSGFVYEHKNNKYIISCEHVLFKADRIVGFDANYNEYELELHGSDMPYDIVVLRFKNKRDEQKFEGLELADFDLQFSKSPLRHIGFWNIDGTSNFKKGQMLNEVSEDLDKIPLTGMGYFESSAFVPGGYSGGPVINDRNVVVGMSTARHIKGTSYALNSKIMKRLIHDIIDYGKVRRVFSGIEFAQESSCAGVTIHSIINNSPASINENKLINKKIETLNDQEIYTIYDLLLIMEEIKPQEIITIGLANGEKVSIQVEYLNEENLAKITKHTLRQYSYPQLSQTEDIDNLLAVIEQGKKYVIKTAGIGSNKVYCLSDLSQLGVIIRMCAPYGFVELGKDDSHIYINEIRFSADKSKRILYY